jgi:hypothetical protein
MSSYFGNLLPLPSAPNPNSVVQMAVSTALGSTGYFNSYIATASGITVTLMQLAASYKGGSFNITNDSTGTITISTRSPDLISISGVTTNTTYLFSGETITLSNIGTYWTVPNLSQQGMRSMLSTALPSTNIGPIFASDMQQIYTYVSTSYFTGYRSIRCGDIEFQATTTARPGFLDAQGASVVKTTYPGLWAYAQENGLNIASASWTAGTGQYGDSGSTTFILPDLRNQFFRAIGTDVDTSSAYGLGTYKTFTVQSHYHTVPIYVTAQYGGGAATAMGTGNTTATTSTGTGETAPRRTAYYPRVYY